MTVFPSVTVVIPTWNRAGLVEQAVASVMAQGWQDWELIVVDDGSDDDTLQRLGAIADPRVRIVALERSGNVARLRNVGAAAGSGALIAFLDSDDLWLPGKLALQVEAFRSAPAAGWCYSDFGHIDIDGRPIPQRAGAFRADNGSILRALLLDRTAAYIGTLVVRRSLFEAVGGFDESLTARADLDLELRLAAVAEVVVVPEVLMQVRDHAGRTTRSITDPHERTARVYEKQAARESDDAIRSIALARWAGQLADAGAQRLAGGEIRDGLGLVRKALALGASPGRVARGIAGAWLARWRQPGPPG